MLLVPEGESKDKVVRHLLVHPPVARYALQQPLIKSLSFDTLWEIKDSMQLVFCDTKKATPTCSSWKSLQREQHQQGLGSASC